MYGDPERDTQHYVRTRFFGGDCCVQVNTSDSTLRDAAKFRRLPNHTFCDAHRGREAQNGGVQRRVVFWFMDRGRLRPPHPPHGASKTPAQGVPQLSQRPSSVSFHAQVTLARGLVHIWKSRVICQTSRGGEYCGCERESAP